ncbi:MAG TPA: glycosyltransferase family 2 protein [Candidatus Binataceae bacterium]|nr:glycosyltransferase family 2 protein [Candidatus Binataceae bacterium]
MTELDIAVVIVTYKCAALTIESLRSVAAERSGAGLQIRAIVVDNASGDAPSVAEAIESNDWGSWISLVTAPKNGGFAYGNNLGIARAYEDHVPSYIYLLNPDAQVRPRAIEILARFLEAHPEVGIAGSSFETLDGSDWPFAFRFPTLMSEMLHGMELSMLMRLFKRWVVAQQMTKVSQPIDWICGASMLIRPAVFESIGGMDENYFLYFEETDFCYRAKKAGFATWYVPESRVMHMIGQTTTVTDVTTGPKRLPSYWFESRRRYFAMTYGIGHAIGIDIVVLLAGLIGLVKRAARGRRHTATPYLIRDLIRHSVIWPRNRKFPPARCRSVPAAERLSMLPTPPVD